MVVGFIGLAVIIGSVLYIKYRIWSSEEDWCIASYVHKRFTITAFDPPPRVKPPSWDYAQGIPRWNTAYIMAAGFDPRYYTPHPGDSEALP